MEDIKDLVNNITTNEIKTNKAVKAVIINIPSNFLY